MIRLAYFGAIVVTGLVIVAVITFSLFPQISIMLQSKSARGANVIIVGGGLAGLSATIEATRHGAHVTIVEKEKMLGGNSMKATSGINGAGTQAQHDLEIEDTPAFLIADTLKSGSGRSSEDLVSVLATNSVSAVEFLTSFNVALKDVVQLGGHSVPRTHRIPSTPDGKPIAVGYTIVSTLKKYIETELSGTVQILTNSKFHALIWDGNRVIGITYRAADGSEHNLLGNVVLTAGGFANDRSSTDSLLKKYVPQLYNLPTTNGPWASGDIIKATAGDGLSLVDMDQVQVHPTGFIEPSRPDADTKFLAPESLRGCGALLLNASGKRFVNELGRRDYVTHAIFDHCGHYRGQDDMPITAVMLMNDEVIRRFGIPSAGFYRSKGLIEEVGTLDQLALKLGVQPDEIRSMINAYGNAAEAGEDEFGKVVFPVIFTEKDNFLLSYVTPSLHYCMGGIAITSKAQVLKDAGTVKEPVPGLYAAGEVTGGVHGANRLGGNSLLECVVYGRIAGQNAADYVHPSQAAL
jgi:cleavage and polyadenylation specificity factor subunit 2